MQNLIKKQDNAYGLVFNQFVRNNSQVEDLMRLIENLFSDQNIEIKCNMIQYYDSHIAVAFTGYDFFSDESTKAIHLVKNLLSDKLHKEISIAVERNVGTVWIRR